VVNDPLFSVSSSQKNRDIKNYFQQSDNSFQQERVRESIRHYAQLKADQKAKELEKQKEENAFKAVYKKPIQCYSPETIEIKMRCINEYVRTRKRFDELYASNLASVNNNVLKVPELNTTKINKNLNNH
jgi:isopropylmalate/homocitrate/citramalate synthase